MEAWVFWPLAVGALTGAILLVVHKNPIHSALSLMLTLFCTAGLFVLLNAGFVAVLQVLVYAGAIMMIFVFVIMLLHLQKEELILRRHRLKKVVGLVLSLFVGLKLASVVAVLPVVRSTLPEDFGSMERVGALLFTECAFPFEAVSVLLLAAIIGAVMISKSRV